MNGDSLQYIAKIDQLPLWGAGFAELWDFSRANENEEARIEAISTVASICYGQPPKDAKKLVERLWKEPNGLPSSAFEFIRAGNTPEISESLRNNPWLSPDGRYAEYRQMPIGVIKRRHKESIATFRLKVPIFIARQVMRHRSFSFQELSRRFVDEKRAPLEFWQPNESSGDYYRGVNISIEIYIPAAEIYSWLIKAGARPEVARAILPQSLYTQFWMMGDVPAWKNYFKLRTDSHAQKEHRQLAEAMLELLKKHQPELYEKVKP